MDLVKRRRLAAFVAVALWVGALFLPALSGGWPGWLCAVLGWLGVFTLTFGWYANLPWLLAAIMALSGARPSRIVVGAGVLLALTVFVHAETGNDMGTDKARPLVGAFVWMASFLPLIYAATGPSRDER